VVGDDPFAVILADDLMDSQPPAIARMAEIFAREQCSLLGVEEVPRDQTASYGIVTIDKMQGDTARIHSIVEKPKPEGRALQPGGDRRYVLTNRIFEMLWTGHARAPGARSSSPTASRRCSRRSARSRCACRGGASTAARSSATSRRPSSSACAIPKSVLNSRNI
jgi:hypothetical protein